MVDEIYMHAEGTIIISESGEYLILLDHTPDQVWMKLSDPCRNAHCGESTTDGFDVAIVPMGFIIFAKLTSDERRIHWKAE